MPPHERERPRHRLGRLGRLVPERVMSPGPRPKCVRRDRAPRRTNEHIWNGHIYGVDRSDCVVETHPLTEPLIQTGRRSIAPGTLRPFLCVECTQWHAIQCSPVPLVATTAQGRIGVEDSLGASAPVRHVPQPPERDRSNRGFARRRRFTVLWSSELNLAQSRRFVVCLGEISNKIGSQAGT